jgi:hypothetical protein
MYTGADPFLDLNTRNYIFVFVLTKACLLNSLIPERKTLVMTRLSQAIILCVKNTPMIRLCPAIPLQFLARSRRSSHQSRLGCHVACSPPIRASLPGAHAHHGPHSIQRRRGQKANRRTPSLIRSQVGISVANFSASASISKG